MGRKRLGASSRYHTPPSASFREHPSSLYTLDLRPISPSDAKHELSCIGCGFGVDTAGRQARRGRDPPASCAPSFPADVVREGFRVELAP
ncbi:hypothetical protein MDA_GLEAN10008020 [Myotis davidii]|uniref:Uncharacterized protein n=1 Tax=Myotis davidii TaxID=225400 RepID=L5LFD3_MYODS|nr:hypothetical protein MDA_GLEAN10008020 [Myotis davidii]